MMVLLFMPFYRLSRKVVVLTDLQTVLGSVGNCNFLAICKRSMSELLLSEDPWQEIPALADRQTRYQTGMRQERPQPAPCTQ